MTEISLDLGEVTLQGTVTGTGPTVLLLHAGGERREVWEPVAATLARRGLRAVAFDLRGHGGSSGRATTLRTLADDVVAMIGSQPGPIVLVGASIGGLAAIAALADPAVADRAAGLVLVDVVPDVPPARARSWLDFHGFGGRYTRLVDDVLGSGAALFATAGALDLPILVVHGGQGSPLDDSDVRRLRAANRRVTVARVPAAGHLVARDAPDELASLVSAHVLAWRSPDNRPSEYAE
ncbi:alpha/beta fold hydrolase [Amycolatopsis sp. lyj-84]|uniref:alpha/beta fold hydrolase n=1 Tax=Amycolatopsis sp. lyj-84 TaxID=2789284 RepID=UPI00397B74E2